MVLIVTLAVFYQVASHGFIEFDDDDYITENMMVQRGISSESVLWSFKATEAHNWHPLTWLSHMLDYELYGLNPKGHHLTSLFFHLVNTFLLWVLLRRISDAPWRSLIVAALFALHPLHAESVAWASERKDVLSAFFCMLTLLAYVLYVEKPSPKTYILSLIFFCLGLMAKPMLVTVPLMLLLLDYWPLNRFALVEKQRHQDSMEIKSKKRSKKHKRTNLSAENSVSSRSPGKSNIDITKVQSLIIEKVPFFILTLASSLITVQAQQKVIKTLESYPLDARISNMFLTYFRYIGKMIWPDNLSIFYPYKKYLLTDWKVILAILGFIMITITVIKLRKYPYLAIGWFWYVITLIPVIGIVQVGLQSMADRYTYIPLIGIFVIVAWGLSDLLSNIPKQRVVFIVATVLIVSVLAVTAWRQLKHWETSYSLYEHAVSVTKENSWAHYNLGLEQVKHGNADIALKNFEASLRIKPNQKDVLLSIGTIFAERGDRERALQYYNHALALDPDFLKAHINIGSVLLEQGAPDKAIVHFNKSQKIAPDNSDAYYLSGLAHSKIGEYRIAYELYNKALELNPDHLKAHNSLGILLGSSGDYERSIFHFRKALDINPQFKPASQNLEATLRFLGKK